MNKENFNFQKLTPTNNADLSVYNNALDFIFENEDIKNVGISGAYSAGKSSVIESYKVYHPNIRFVHISLAHFESVTKDLKQSTEQSENVLEGKILNQLLHQIEANKIPQTNFRVKKKLSLRKNITDTVLIVLITVLLTYMIFFNTWTKYINSLSGVWFKSIFQWTINPKLLVISGMVCTAIFMFAVFQTVKLLYNKSLFKKLKLQGNEIEIFEQKDDSYFDKYLNEVLYLFENSKADVIVFEDMDRYNVNQIFQRLREVNTLINNNRKNDGKKPIRFLYLLRDDIFISKDRTKFFDFIIPIVPVIDGSNSYDQFIAHFKQGGIFELFDENFLQGISLYVDDMRILKNIYNEFVIYNNRINTTEQDFNKLLALIVYKNLFPRDFSDLQLNKGFIYTLFSKKEEFIKGEIKSLENQINTIREKISASNTEHLQTVEELNQIYNTRFQQLRGYYGRNEELKKTEAEFEQRKEALESRKDNGVEKYKEQISMLQLSIQKIQTEKLSEIITRENIDQIFKVESINEIGDKLDFFEIKGSDYFDLLKYLVRNGFIDETYPDYMTYFYENSLNRIDKVFLRSVTDERAKEYTYQLKNPQMVVSRLNIVDFDHPEILNFDLVSYLLTNQTTKNSERLNRFVVQLHQSKNYKFIGEYFATKRNEAIFVSYINKHWPNIFKGILAESEFSEHQKKLYSIASLYYSSNDNLRELNVDDVLTTFISNRRDFLQIESPDITRLIETLSLLNIRFADIDYELSDKNLFSAVYTNNLYELNFSIICLMLKVIYGYTDINECRHKNYTLVLSKPSEVVVRYIGSNINQYFQVVFENCEQVITDSEETVIQILNNQDFEDVNKQVYTEYLQTRLASLRSIENTVWWPVLVKNHLIEYSAQNVIQYFCCSGNALDNVIVDFINQYGNTFNLNYDAIDEEFGKGEASKFFNAVVKCTTMSNDKYKKILSALHRQYSSFNIEGISDDKLNILIDLNVITLKPDVLAFMREHYSKCVVHFIEKNIAQYADGVITTENFDLDEAISVLGLNVDDKYKISLLEFTKEAVSVIDKPYSEVIKAHILQNNLNMEEIPLLLKSYDSSSKVLKSLIEEIVIKHYEDIFQNQYPIPVALCLRLLSAHQLAYNIKMELFCLVLTDLNERECKQCLNLLELNGYLSLFDGKRPKFEATGTNESILKIFREKGWITRFDVDKDDGNYYRAIGRKVHLQSTLPPELL